MPEEGLSLERWANFYLVASTAAATLLGLLFILITLASERRPKEQAGIRLYLTPTVVLFGSVLCLAALLTFPTQSRFTASLCAYLVGGAGILYSASLLVIRDGGQKPRWDNPLDVVMYVALPCVAYGLLISGGALLTHSASHGLVLVAVGMLSLIVLAVRNSWAIAVDVVSTPRQEE
jgi:hypothetical protein